MAAASDCAACQNETADWSCTPESSYSFCLLPCHSWKMVVVSTARMPMTKPGALSCTSVTVAMPSPRISTKSESLILVEVETPKRTACAARVIGTIDSFVIW